MPRRDPEFPRYRRETSRSEESHQVGPQSS
jgi:hypothetical protein